MEIPEGWGGLNQKTFRGRGMDILWNNTLFQCAKPLICLLDLACKALFTNIKRECQNWPEKPLALGGFGT